MATTFKKCPKEVHDLAVDILESYPSHKPLLVAGLKIDLVFAYAEKGAALTLHGQQCLGIARKIKLKDRVMGRGDVEVSLDYSWWQDATEAEQRALLDHELHHFMVELEGNKAAFTDDIGRPVVKLRRHDFEFGWFALIAQRHGAASQECQQAAKMLEQGGKVLFQPDLFRRTVTDLADAADKVLSNDSKTDLHDDEELIQQCIEVIRTEQKACVALLQRRLYLGYIRAARIMDELERRGIVGPDKGADPRDILILSDEQALAAAAAVIGKRRRK